MQFSVGVQIWSSEEHVPPLKRVLHHTSTLASSAELQLVVCLGDRGLVVEALPAQPKVLKKNSLLNHVLEAITIEMVTKSSSLSHKNHNVRCCCALFTLELLTLLQNKSCNVKERRGRPWSLSGKEAVRKEEWITPNVSHLREDDVKYVNVAPERERACRDLETPFLMTIRATHIRWRARHLRAALLPTVVQKSPVSVPPKTLGENDFYTPQVLGGAALFDNSAPAVYKIQGP